MQLAAELLFWASLACVMLSYAGYPLISAVWPFRQRHATGRDLPTVTLIISAYKEQAVIARKIENALALDYPEDRLEVVVISDASDDGTDEIVTGYAQRGVILFRQEPRAGKSAGLTRFVPQTRGEVIVFSDANSMYQPDALRQLVRHFGDEAVGYVVGQQRYESGTAEVSVAESLYWRFETWIKRQESRLGSVVGGDGAIYAIRRELFRPLRPDDISDFTLPLQIVAAGYRGIYEPSAICYEQTALSFPGEFRRKARIVNRSLRAVLRVKGVLNPFRVGIFSVQLLLHKVLRWFVPFFLLSMLCCSAYLAVESPGLYRGMLMGQLVVYLTAAGRFVPGLGRFKAVYVTYYFCLVNAAAAVGILQQVFGHSIATWTPERSDESVSVSERPFTESSRSV